MSCDLSDPNLLNVYQEIISGKETNWMICGYRETRDVITFYQKGSVGFEEMRSAVIKLEEVVYVFLRMESKFALITYISDKAPGVKRARALVHGRFVGNLFKDNNLQITITTPQELMEMNIRSKLRLDTSRGNLPRTTDFVTKQSSLNKSNTSDTSQQERLAEKALERNEGGDTVADLKPLPAKTVPEPRSNNASHQGSSESFGENIVASNPSIANPSRDVSENFAAMYDNGTLSDEHVENIEPSDKEDEEEEKAPPEDSPPAQAAKEESGIEKPVVVELPPPPKLPPQVELISGSRTALNNPSHSSIANLNQGATLNESRDKLSNQSSQKLPTASLASLATPSALKREPVEEKMQAEVSKREEKVAAPAVKVAPKISKESLMNGNDFGFITEAVNSGQSWKRRLYRFVNNALELYTFDETLSIVRNLPQSSIKGVESIEDEVVIKNSVRLKVSNDKDVMFYCDSKEELNKIMKMLKI